jgi:hypothetical protein
MSYKILLMLLPLSSTMLFFLHGRGLPWRLLLESMGWQYLCIGSVMGTEYVYSRLLHERRRILSEMDPSSSLESESARPSTVFPIASAAAAATRKTPIVSPIPQKLQNYGTSDSVLYTIMEIPTPSPSPSSLGKPIPVTTSCKEEPYYITI